MAKYKVSVEQDVCIGCGACIATCDKFFELKDDGKSHLKNGAELEGNKSELEVDEADFSCVKEAADGCPVNAIHIKNDNGDVLI